ncbi:MAG: heat-inducible transcription repressor HrcA [Caldisericum exile]|uniref:Heat-inducible transcription repressor HrcA n=2 Tax=Caldisericaceae TaxID=693073 RepID=A0A2J6WEB0_9BACT|nr:MAG: heat-inducible transcription repressor HrcA [Caldisericum exile]
MFTILSYNKLISIRVIILKIKLHQNLCYNIYAMELDKRKSEVLKEVVKEYIETGEPVSSERVARNVNFPISPATVRNYMAELDEMGFLTQVHASSGRIPTTKGFRYFVEESLKERKRLKLSEIKFPEPEKIKNLSEILSQISELISKYTNEISLVVSPCFEDEKLRYIHFFLATNLLFTVIVTTTQTTEAILLGNYQLSEENLRLIENFLNGKLQNLTLKQALKEILSNAFYIDELGKSFSQIIGKFYETLKNEYEKRKTKEIFIRGISNLLTTQIQIAEERLKFLLNILEEKEVLERILNDVTKDEKLQLVIGEENKLPELWDYSLITVKYSIKELEGTLGLLGPIRMDYIKGIFVLEEIANKLEQLSEKILG